MERHRGILRAWLAMAAATMMMGCSQPQEVSRGEWPEWRGPGGQGISSAVDLPEVWKADSPSIRWRAEVPGAGISSPIASGGRVFLTSAWEKRDGESAGRRRRGDIQLAVAALDSQTGEVLWQTQIASSKWAKKHSLNTHATPTPVTDGTRVYCYFGSTLAAVDLEGGILWSEEVDGSYAQYSRYGAAASPVLTEDAVVVVQDREYGETNDVGWIAAFDKATGERLWRDEWQHTCCSYVTPLLFRTDSGVEIILSTSGEVVGYDAKSGERLWRQKYGSTQPVPSMVTDGKILVIPGGVHEKSIFVLKLSGSGRNTAAELLWTTKKGVPEISSPVLYQGLLFTITERGIMICYDPKTGKVVWRKRMEAGGYHSSLVAGDGKVYALNDEGITSVVAAEPEFELISVNDLGDGGALSSPAFADGCLLIRTWAHLYCIEEQS